MSEKLFHISDQPGIAIFEPRPSPSKFDLITGDVVFAITETLLHNYLLPRECPRVTYYTSAKTTTRDKDIFLGSTTADHVVVVESAWYQRIRDAVLYCYELPPDRFTLLDDCAGYHISYQAVAPISITVVTDVMAELMKRNIELRFTPHLGPLADAVVRSTLNYSLIRMRNAGK